MWTLTLLFLSASACMERDPRPYQAWLDELAADDTGDPSDPTYDRLCSEDGGAAISLTITNASAYDADLYWVDSACEPRSMILLEQGASTPMNASVGHVFRLRQAFDELQWIAERRVVEGDTALVMGGDR
ncbi:MAG: hypothetical protein JXX28_08450 [Deltaproteobacteria bacterium]|nr:hypothetical protein [Deltaproteobacteria bacterium]